MNLSLRVAALALAGVAAIGHLAFADSAKPNRPSKPLMKLNYQSSVVGCPTAGDFADQVSVQVGFAAWDDKATAVLHVSIKQGDGQVVATIEQADGSSQTLHAPACDALYQPLLTAVSVVVDPPVTVPGPPNPPTMTPASSRSERVTLHMREVNGQAISIQHMIAAPTTERGTNPLQEDASTPACVTPCDISVPPGETLFAVTERGNEHPSIWSATPHDRVNIGADIQTDSTVDFRFASRQAVRRHQINRWRVLSASGLVLGYAATAMGSYAADRSTTSFGDAWGASANHFAFNVGGALIGELVGISISLLCNSSEDSQDFAAMTVHPADAR